jgi:hypothetical protein
MPDDKKITYTALHRVVEEALDLPPGPGFTDPTAGRVAAAVFRYLGLTGNTSP